MSTTTTNAIEKQILLRAPRARVWRAISDSREFGKWFQAVIDGPFVPGRRVTGRITYPGYEHGWAQQMTAIDEYLRKIP